MFAERLQLIKGRKQFHTAPHLRFDKLDHGKSPENFKVVFLSLSQTSVVSHGFQILF